MWAGLGDDLVLSSVTRRCAAPLGVILTTPQIASGWGWEGHHVIAILAEHCLRPETAPRVRGLLGPENLEQASVWADEYRRDHPQTGPWYPLTSR
jgi:hypothetical protein